MSLLIRLVTVSFMLALLVIGGANYNRMHSKASFGQAVEDLQDAVLPMLHNLHFCPPRFELGSSVPTGYVEMPMCLSAGPEDMRPF